VSAAIEVADLRKTYGATTAVDGVSFTVDTGECVGILGPNGAGKTTTLEMIEGLREPDSGTVSVLGLSPWPRNRELLMKIGVQLQASAFIEKLTAIEQLRTMTDLYGVPRGRADELLEQVGLSEKADVLAESLSGGQQQRLSIACALVHRPQVIFLDEPSAGLDPTARRNLWDLLGEVRSEGTTVVLTTHYMEEAEVLCDRVAIMDRGRILALGPPPTLVRELDAPTSVLLPPGVLSLEDAGRLDGVDSAHEDAGALRLVTQAPSRVLTTLAQRDALAGLQVRSATLEDVFVALTGRTLHEHEHEDAEEAAS
jgi:ABC-2 type transport system ATP-binding protein